jgi:nucleoside-diphosphate-sugar epimerase
MGSAPTIPSDETTLEELLSRPDEGAVGALERCAGDCLILGAGGKMGPSLARMLRRAADTADASRARRRIIAVSRFTERTARERLEAAGIETVVCDLTDPSAVEALPRAPNVIFMAGQKFGTRDAPPATWAANAAVPAHVAPRLGAARTVVFSTGNVYPLTPVASGGSTETDPPQPAGEYASSCLARERIFEYYAQRQGAPLALVRLNYAIDLRYGVLVDIALAVYRGQPLDLRMGHVNIIWQGDANARAIACLEHASTPAFVVNVTGAGTLGVRDLATRFGDLFGRDPIFQGEEAGDALLSDTSRMRAVLGEAPTSVEWMIGAIAEWIARGGELLGKPTSFQTRDGSF